MTGVAKVSLAAPLDQAWQQHDQGQPYRVMLKRADALTEVDRNQWAQLAERAGGDNVFAKDWFVLSALRFSDQRADVRLAIVTGGDGAWLGVLPLISHARFGQWPVRNWSTWLATNQFLGSPLVAAGTADAFWQALLSHLDELSSGEIMLYCRQFAEDDQASAALLAYCEASGRALHVIDQYDRRMHRPGREAQASGKKKAKAAARLRSLRAKLARDHGDVEVTFDHGTANCEEWLDAFLAMERSGWKGRAGSALACQAETQGLFRDVILRGLEYDCVRLATLTAGGKPLAMSSWFVVGDQGFGFKMAFDESYRSYAPGQLLMRAIADQIHQTPDLQFDTCTPRGTQYCRQMWGDARTIFDCAIAVGSRRQRWVFDATMLARTFYGAAKKNTRGGRWHDLFSLVTVAVR